jgi:hypothetical protein
LLGAVDATATACAVWAWAAKFEDE